MQGILDIFRQELPAYWQDAKWGGSMNSELPEVSREDIANFGLDMTPVVGGVKGAQEEFEDGNYGWSAFNAATVPMDLMSFGLLGTMGRGALKSIKHGDTIFGSDIDYDPTFLKRTSQKEKDRINKEFSVTTTPKEFEPEAPVKSIADYEGFPFITSMSDRTAAGDEIMALNGVHFKDPIARLGGQDHMIYGDSFWASDHSPVSGIYNKAELLKERYGKDPLFLPFTMAGSGSDFAHMTGETMLEFAKSNMGRADMTDLNSAIKDIYSPWKGLRSPNMLRQWQEMPTEARKGIQNMMDRDFRDRGGVGLTDVRLGLADPNQLTSNTGSFYNAGFINPELRHTAKGSSGHPSYAGRVEGTFDGRIAERDVNLFHMLPEWSMNHGIDANDINKPFLSAKGKEVQPMYMARQSGALGGFIDHDLLMHLDSQGLLNQFTR